MRYLFINLSLPTYVKLSWGVFGLFTAVTLGTFLVFLNHGNPIVRSGWSVSAGGACVGGLEAFLALGRSMRRATDERADPERIRSGRRQALALLVAPLVVLAPLLVIEATGVTWQLGGEKETREPVRSYAPEVESEGAAEQRRLHEEYERRRAREREQRKAAEFERTMRERAERERVAREQEEREKAERDKAERDKAETAAPTGSVAPFERDETFTDAAAMAQYWNVRGIAASTSGARGGRSSRCSLQPKFGLVGDFTIDIDASFGKARFTNTGGSYLTVCGHKFKLNSRAKKMTVKVRLHREGNTLEYTRGEHTERREIAAEHADKPASFYMFWRSRTAHFRSVRVRADEAVFP